MSAVEIANKVWNYEHVLRRAKGDRFICGNQGVRVLEILNPGGRITHMVFVPVVQSSFEIVESFDESDRSEGGFGHTGSQ